ncbi:S26 family signal peptidase [Kineococcus aurantiacus]|uniref:Signal peptidase n=1 Tax=Kineococcus aurantiacus TaxID=37633 RepID=A0A7Y9J1D6_9ACTN|nr:S26 family signal peptidase [Kineococcus aurantiacus]NYD23046.1 signal peptidase [Kineococcus aurantiacus]
MSTHHERCADPRTLPGPAASPVTAPAPPQDAPRRGLRHWAREGLLTTAAAGGLLCLLALAAAVFLDTTLVLFRTGSMSPAMPAGAVAVVRAVPAAEVAVGDVVTVERPGALPVTHRVTATAADPAGPPASRLLTLKGDANASADPRPYAVERVRRVVVSAPHLGSWIDRARSPVALGLTTLGVGGLVTWTFWPASAGTPSGPGPGAGSRRRPARR